MLTVPIVAVGNSRGIRIPKKLLAQLGSPDSVYLDLRQGELVITPITSPRLGWDDLTQWKGAKLNADDLEWLDAPLTDDAA